MYYENRIIAMLDILGMATKLTDRESLQKTTDKYSALIAEAQKIVISPVALEGSPEQDINNFEAVEFVFDTIVLVSYPITPQATSQFITGVSSLMGLFFKEQLPLRGSIGIGDYLVDTGTNIFLSNIFKKLNNDELQQEWSGCCILNDNVNIILNNLIGIPSINKSNQLQSSVVHLLDVPLKEAKTEERYCINWIYLLLDNEISRGLRYMINNKSKHQNTKYYIETIKSFHDDVQKLDKSMSPATQLKSIKTRAGVRLLFTDDDGTPVDPSGNFTLSFNQV